MPHNKNKHKHGSHLWMIPFAVLALATLMAALIHGHNIALLNPKGLISSDESKLMYVTVAILFCVAIPAVTLLFFTAWHYRESNNHAKYDPEIRQKKVIVALMWLIPSSFMLLLAFILWNATHRLVPQDPIASTAKPLQIQVVALRWKWVFIYPQQNIATVNYVQVPVHTPVEFDLTADDAPMSSFWIPNLGGQLYAMTGMVNKLNLMADSPGSYPGSSPEINGAGFAGMQFAVHASSVDDFNNWVHEIKQANTELDDTTYAKLLKPSESNPPAFYASSETGLYGKVLMKYMAPMDDSKSAAASIGNDAQTAGSTDEQ